MPHDEVAVALSAADEAMRTRRWRAAIDLLMAANAETPHRRLEERLVELRHSGYRQITRATPSPDWPPELPDTVAGTGVPPETDVGTLDATTLGSALQHHGALLVRGLLDAATAASLLEVAQAAMSSLERCHEAGSTDEGDSPWFKPFVADEGYSFEPLAQRAARLGGGLLLAESPRALYDVIVAYQRCGVRDVIAEYLGEPPALSVKKSTIRRATPESPTGWHQDRRVHGDRHPDGERMDRAHGLRDRSARDRVARLPLGPPCRAWHQGRQLPMVGERGGGRFLR